VGFKVLECSNYDHIASCASTLSDGGIIVFPTDTVYGIGCNPYYDESVERIFQIKDRSEDKPLPVMGYSISDIEKLVHMSPLAKSLAQYFWPGALTIVSPCKDNNISRRVMAGGDNLAVRIPDNRCTQSLLRFCKYLIGTSANVSGRKPCTSSYEVLSSGLSGFDLVLDGGTLGGGIESTIIEVIDSNVRILREGVIKSDKVYDTVSKILYTRPKIRNEC
jgi:L-threonylcarbamoyladenylate synthase